MQSSFLFSDIYLSIKKGNPYKRLPFLCVEVKFINNESA